MQSNAVLIGRDFERQVYEFLNKRFFKVIWLSHNTSPSPYDFKCINKDGKEFFVEAKFVGNGTKPKLEDKQKEADFIATNQKNTIILIPKREFGKRVYIKSPFEVLRLSPEIVKILDRNKKNNESRDGCLLRLFFENGWLLPKEEMILQYSLQVLRDEIPLSEKQQKTFDFFKKRLPSEYEDKLNKKERLHKR